MPWLNHFKYERREVDAVKEVRFCAKRTSDKLEMSAKWRMLDIEQRSIRFMRPRRNRPKQHAPGLGRASRELEPVGDQAPYAVAMSGKTASILVFSVAALNGLTI
jgi:hypothetical protein